MADYTLTQADFDGLTASNSLIYINNVIASVGTPINNGNVVKVTAGAGYKFYPTPALFSTNSIFFYGEDWGDAVYGNFILSDDDQTATYTMNSTYFEYLTSGTEVIPMPDADYTLTQADFDALAISQSTISINDVTASVDDPIYIGDVVKITAGGSFVFENVIGQDYSVSLYFLFKALEPKTYGEFTLSEDMKTGTFTLDSEIYEELIVGAVQETEVVGNNHIYKITQDQLTELNAVRFVQTYYYNYGELYDYGKFIINLIELPFELSGSVLLDPEKIMLATYDTNILANVIGDDSISVDMGSISVPAQEGNLLDFKDTVCILRLPRASGIVLDSSYVIGETISIEYLIDCYTGIATININSSKTNSCINTTQVDIGISIPLANVTVSDTNVRNLKIDAGGDNGIYTPFIEIVKNDHILADGFFTSPIIDEKVLTGQSGFIKVNEIDLITKATYSEKKQIINMLKEGVILR
jgi:hypothetical protein